MINNINVRTSTKKDVSTFYKLWKICFNDSDNFCDWLFNNRFFPEYSTVLEKDGEIVSCMQGVPYIVNFRGVEVNSVMLCGVSTEPNNRKQGFMSRLFTHSINQLKSKNVSLAVHTPAVLESYFSFQHFPVANAQYIEETNSINQSEFKFEKLEFTKDNANILHNIYIEEIANKYSGAIHRTFDDFFRKWSDYNSDGGVCYAMFSDNIILGYSFFYATDTEIVCVEAVTKIDLYDDLVQCILNIDARLTTKIKLPPDADIKNYTAITKQKGVAGCVNLQNLLKALSIPFDTNIEVVDNIVSDNNGIFNVSTGEKTINQPILKIDIGYLIQILIGYDTFKNLQNKITIYNEIEYNKLNELLPLQHCYIIDEY